MYGLLLSGGVFLAILLARKLLIKNNQYNSDVFWGVIFWMIVFGVIGARLYHVIDFRYHYLWAPQKIYQVWLGGLGIFGAIIGSLTGLLLFTKVKKQNAGTYLDVLSIVAPLAQAIGRVGNYFNHEVVGTLTNLPWGITTTNIKELRYHPIFAYEAILNLMLSLLLYKLYSGKKYKVGALVCFYLMGYSIIRFLMEFLRLNPWIQNGVNVAQTLCVIIFIGSLSAYIKYKKS